MTFGSIDTDMPINIWYVYLALGQNELLPQSDCDWTTEAHVNVRWTKLYDYPSFCRMRSSCQLSIFLTWELEKGINSKSNFDPNSLKLCKSMYGPTPNV